MIGIEFSIYSARHMAPKILTRYNLLQVQDERGVRVLPLGLRVEEDYFLAGDNDVEFLPAVPPDVLLRRHLQPPLHVRLHRVQVAVALRQKYKGQPPCSRTRKCGRFVIWERLSLSMELRMNTCQEGIADATKPGGRAEARRVEVDVGHLELEVLQLALLVIGTVN